MQCCFTNNRLYFTRQKQIGSDEIGSCEQTFINIRTKPNTRSTQNYFPVLPRIRRLLKLLRELLCITKLWVLRPRCLWTLLSNGCGQVRYHLLIFEDTPRERLTKMRHDFRWVHLRGSVPRGRTSWGWISCRGKIPWRVGGTVCGTRRPLTWGHTWNKGDYLDNQYTNYTNYLISKLFVIFTHIPGIGSLKCSLNHLKRAFNVAWIRPRYLNPSGVTETYSIRGLVRGI